ncbi:hypothetical protein LMG26685_03501 [Achromobacter mucicolens]|nr:hypothetical protein LMG26685_03501 [Achromobacter mucicolens]
MDMDASDSGPGTTPPFDGLRAYLLAVQSRDDLHRLRQLEQRNDGLKRSVQRLPEARCAAAEVSLEPAWKHVLRAAERKK